MPRELSPETRQRLSEMAQKMHAEGKLGRPRGTKDGAGIVKARPRKRRIGRRVAEEAMEEKNARAIVEVFKDAIHPSQPISIRLKGAEAWARLASEHAKQEDNQEANAQQHRSREELLELLSAKLLAGPSAQLIRGQLEQADFVDAEVVEVDGGDAAAS